jgi:hypothetical protein
MYVILKIRGIQLKRLDRMAIQSRLAYRLKFSKYNFDFCSRQECRLIKICCYLDDWITDKTLWSTGLAVVPTRGTAVI